MRITVYAQEKKWLTLGFTVAHDSYSSCEQANCKYQGTWKVYLENFLNAIEALSAIILQTYQAKILMEKKEDNSITKEVFEYVTSKEFSDRVGVIYNNASRVRQEVQKIRNYNERGLSAVEKLVSGISENTVGIAGDLQGLSLSSDNLLSTINLKLEE